MPIRRFIKYTSFFFLLITLPTACGINKTMTVASTASLLEDVARASYKQSDLKLVREGMPSYLMLIDGMVEALPENKQLLITAAQSYADDAKKKMCPIFSGRPHAGAAGSASTGGPWKPWLNCPGWWR